jgi:hypothetical protein
MALVFSTRLAGGDAGVGGTTIYTAPAAGQLIVVKSASLIGGSVAPTTAVLLCSGGGGICGAVGIPEFDSFTWFGSVVLELGEELQLDVGAGVVYYHIDGYSLTLP